MGPPQGQSPKRCVAQPWHSPLLSTAAFQGAHIRMLAAGSVATSMSKTGISWLVEYIPCTLRNSGGARPRHGAQGNQFSWKRYMQGTEDMVLSR